MLDSIYIYYLHNYAIVIKKKKRTTKVEELLKLNNRKILERIITIVISTLFIAIKTIAVSSSDK